MNLARLAEINGRIFDVVAVAAVNLIEWADRTTGRAQRRFALYHHPGFDDIRIQNEEVEHYSTTAEGLVRCKADCMFHRCPE